MLRHETLVWALVGAFLCGGSSAVAAADGHEHSESRAADKDSAKKALHEFLEKADIDTEKDGWKTKLPKPPSLKFQKDHVYYWNVDTNMGAIKIRLLPDVAPMHVSSTMYLAELGFYDGLKFHRVIPGFMAQGGCPLGSGRGSPGYKYKGEFDDEVRHDRPGLLSMANAGPGTDGSQFFITFVPTPHLDGKHTIFGEVVEGMDTLKELEKHGSRQGQTSKPLSMRKTTITIEAAKKEQEGDREHEGEHDGDGKGEHDG